MNWNQRYAAELGIGKHCDQCGSELPSPAGNHCDQCGSKLMGTKED